MNTPTLPLSLVVNVAVQVNPQGVSAPVFNQGIIISQNSVISNANRAVQFQGGTSILAQLITYGFALTDPTYLAASAYLKQTPTPQTLWIGLQDATAIQTLTIGVAGTGYVVGDVVNILGAGNGATIKVLTVTAGAVTTFQILTQGTGYAIASGQATSGGTGSALTMNITAIGETPLQALTACRNAAPQWYLATVLGAADADNILCAQYAQTAAPQMQFFFITSSASALNGTTGNIFSTLKAGSYNRYQGCYTTLQGTTTTIATTSGSTAITLTSATNVVVGSTVVAAGVPTGTTLVSLVGTAGVLSANATATASGVSTSFQVAPNNAYFAAALMGMAMGRNTYLANSYFILPFKTLVGMTTEPLSTTQVATINGNNGNVYVNYANSYSSYTPGITGNGQYFDQIIGLDMLAADIQYGVANTFFLYPVIPMNDPGETILLQSVNQACQLSVTRGFISGGIWNGPNVLGLQPGEPVPDGYLNQAQSYSFQTSGARALRQAMPIYSAIILTEGAQSILIGVFVQQ